MLDIPDDMHRQLKSRATAEGTSVKCMVLRGMERVLAEQEPKRRRKRMLPIIKSKEPETIDITNEQIYDLIEFP